MFYVVGLGNPGEEYERTRHNVGRMALDSIFARGEFSDWKADKTLRGEIAKGYLGDEKVWLIFPTTFMNKSGTSVKSLITSEKKAEKLIVLYDDVDLPLGTIKLAFNRGSGGHKGIESITRAIKTKAFVRIRIGICPTTPSGTLKKPQGEKAVLDFLLGELGKKEQLILPEVFLQCAQAVETVVREGKEAAMNRCN